ncbi:MAG: YbgA family protein [Methanohalobium sp.]|uniref:YbgA family protein n=1 Tax=Methanohalobium sp. TaxID=2837493 RepID=UPI00397C2548
MKDFTKPCIIISKCIEFSPCRYNGEIIRSAFIKKLKPYINFIPVCPECAIGLGVPRKPIYIIMDTNRKRLIQTSTGNDLTDEMINVTDSYLNSLGDVEGFILKSNSPSCGVKNVKAYSNCKKIEPVTTTASGFFGAEVMNRYPSLGIEDEKSLMDMRIREHFLTKVFTLSRFKRIDNIEDLIQFNKDNKLLFTAYNPGEKHILDEIVSESKNKSLTDILNKYLNHLYKIFIHPQEPDSNVDIIMDVMNKFSSFISNQEKLLFMENIQRYREGRITLSASRTLLKSWMIRSGNTTYVSQSFFNPYPVDLMGIDHIMD